MTDQDRMWLLQQSAEFKQSYVRRLQRTKMAQRNLAIFCLLIACASALCLYLTVIWKI